MGVNMKLLQKECGPALIQRFLSYLRRLWLHLLPCFGFRHLEDLLTLAQTEVLPRDVFNEVLSGTFRSIGYLRPRANPLEVTAHTELNGVRTCGILGSGESLTRLTQAERSLLESVDLFTFNNSHLADFSPRFHVMQFPLQRMAWWRTDWDSRGQEILEKKILQIDKDRLCNTTLLKRSSRTLLRSRIPSRFERWADRAYPNSQELGLVFLPGGKLGNLRKTLEDLASFFQPGLKRDYLLVPKPGSTLPMMILLAARLGYQQILLAGCDLLNSRHFYDSSDYLEKFDPENLTGVFNLERGSFVLSGLFAEVRETSPIDDVIEVADFLREARLCDVLLINEDSKYFPLLTALKI